MKTAYSSWTHPHWRYFKQAFPQRDEAAFVAYHEMVWTDCLIRLSRDHGTSALDPTIMLFDRDSLQLVAHCMFLWHFRPINHYFLAPGVADFCASSVRELSADYCKRLPLCEPADAPRQCHAFSPYLATFPKVQIGAPAVPISNLDWSKMTGGFAVHFPTAERRRSIMVIPDFCVRTPEHLMHYWAGLDDGEDCALLHPDSRALTVTDGDWMCRVVFGLSLYMDAFPDAVVPSARDIVAHDHWYAGAHHVINRTKAVDEERRHLVSPHWRRGHFRLLSAPRFVHKHGQTVWVRGTFVLGHAIDVLGDTPALTVMAP